MFCHTVASSYVDEKNPETMTLHRTKYDKADVVDFREASDGFESISASTNSLGQISLVFGMCVFVHCFRKVGLGNCGCSQSCHARMGTKRANKEMSASERT